MPTTTPKKKTGSVIRRKTSMSDTHKAALAKGREEGRAVRLYPAHAAPDDAERVEVVEIANGRLAHTRVTDGAAAGRIAVFSRWITNAELQQRAEQFAADPAAYTQQILQGTGAVIKSSLSV